ncbi:MAG: bifunctional folylpolyglutamate synthase/dihydrofolate synthase [Flavobacteriaceae bacterium]|nr:bifunctional folylpolyglutamate synthase/dihydrofolate synthase [Flavobacteriaceae bacterium]
MKDFRERIRINGTPVAEEFIVSFVQNNKSFFEAEAFSFFEMTVALAFDYFASQQVDVAVIEVGLGGRLDATNVISPEACLITNISLDHQQFLGTTRAEIAAEKAGIIKPRTTVGVVELDAETFPVFEAIAQEKNASLHLASQRQFTTDLLGDYQKQNITGVISLLHVLSQFSVSKLHIIDGLQRVVKNTGLRGRWEILDNQPKIIADVAHNPAGLQAVFAQLKKEQSDKLHIIFGVVSDKKVSEITTFLPKKAHYYLCTANVPRAMNTSELAVEFIKNDFSFSTHDSVQKAFEAAKTAASRNDLIFVGGSLFVVAEILP